MYFNLFSLDCKFLVLIDFFPTTLEFATFPSNSKTLITPKKGDLLFFEGNVFHRVIDSDKKRISLAFNIYAP